MGTGLSGFHCATRLVIMGPAVDELVFGADAMPGLVAVEHQPVRGTGRDRAILYVHDGVGFRTEDTRLDPFCWIEDATLLEGCGVEYAIRELQGEGPLKQIATFHTWSDLKTAQSHLRKTTGQNATDPRAPYYVLNDPVQQYLLHSGRTLFKGMQFSDLRRLQVDIETLTTAGYDFPNPDREEDKIVAIALADQSGWADVLTIEEDDEAALLNAFVQIVTERDPDVIEGHNLFNFDLPYLTTRAKRHKVKLKLGRGGKEPRSRSSRFSVAERTLSYTRFEIPGRHIIDTFFLVQIYDVTYRSLESFSLKSCARHFGVAPEGRTYVEGSEITRIWNEDPQRIIDYARDDILETRGLGNILSPIYFHQCRMLPYTYQNVCVRGNAAKIDALMLRAYLQAGQALPQPGPAKPFEGGYTDLFHEGLAAPVHHCDVRSLYPSLMLTRRMGPRNDSAGVFLTLLDYLRTVRLEAKDKARKGDPSERTYYDAMQSCFKILINSFYGYLGFSMAHFCDFDQAEAIAAEGRKLLRLMINQLRALGAEPLEIDTDGVYYKPPEFNDDAAQQAFEQAVQRALPDGIDIEFDGVYKSMYCHKMKNYALLSEDGTMTIKGAALKSRGLEPFQRNYLKDYLRLRLEGRDAEIAALQDSYREQLTTRVWPIETLAKSERLQTDPKTYEAKRSAAKKTPKRAAYELALHSDREYKAGDMIRYYVAGNKKSVVVSAAARSVRDWDAGNRDENVPYYLAKLEALFAKFGSPTSARQGELF